MSVAPQVLNHLNQQHIHFDQLLHPYSETALSTARVSHIPSRCMAKAVVLESQRPAASWRNRGASPIFGKEDYVMAVIPADNRLLLHRINNLLKMDLKLVAENKLLHLFTDCAPGAIPIDAAPYAMRSVWDIALQDEDTLYFEGGDHETLVCVQKEALPALNPGGCYAAISYCPQDMPIHA